MMADDERPSFSERIGRYWWALGLAALIGWFAMLWLMFGDVL